MNNQTSLQYKSRENEKIESVCFKENQKSFSIKGWLQPNIIVRIIARDMRNGSLYMKQGYVADVLSPGLAQVVLNGGEICEGN